jgi:hypothetical protein
MYGLINIMETLVLKKRKKVNRWNKSYISPGPVSAVGDVVQNIRLKQSCPELAMRWDLSKSEVKQRGSGVSDGTVPNNYTGSSLTTTVVSDYYHSPNESDVVGFAYQDLRPNDLAASTRELGAPQFGWKSTQASVNKALVMGKQFLPVTQGYPKSGVSRGPEPRSTFLSDLNYVAPNPAGLITGTQPTQLNPTPTQVDPVTGNPVIQPTTTCGTTNTAVPTGTGGQGEKSGWYQGLTDTINNFIENLPIQYGGVGMGLGGGNRYK